MSDGKYFSTTKRGEIKELKGQLNEHDQGIRKEAVKKVIASMTVGKDVSSLFPDVVNCMQTQDIEMKKLVYLYLINYAKSKPDLAIMAVNTFVNDAKHPNPLIRALAIRTMSCIRVDKITEYLCEPLRKCLTDKDPYVRKTAVIAVAKLYDINPELCEDQGFLQMLNEGLSDENPMVVANAVAALAEITEQGQHQALKINHPTLNKLLTALNDCTEWGQVFILDSLVLYRPRDSHEAETVIERIVPRLQHANGAVVLSCIKVILTYMDMVSNPDFVRNACRKMTPPLEIQYVALRNINLIVQKRPQILHNEMKVFFCKYNDPIYVKLEKLDIMVMLASDRNVDQLLLEFKEYATEADVEFVRRAVRAIGRCAIKLERAAERCIAVLVELIQTKVSYVVQEAVVVIKDIFRKYPNRYENVIGTLCENLESLDEPEAKASMFWIIGEYADRIENADELLDQFLENFAEETAPVQLQLLTAAVKLFLKQPDDTQDMVQRVLNLATQESDNPDLRDRGFIYWRLLSTDPEAAKQVVLAEKPLIHDTGSLLARPLLEELTRGLSSLASVYHKTPETFVSKLRRNPIKKEEEDEEEEEQTSVPSVVKAVDLLQVNTPPPQPTGVVDMLGLDESAKPEPTEYHPRVLLEAKAPAGVEVKGAFCRIQGRVVARWTLTNKTMQSLGDFDLQFNKNKFGCVPQPGFGGLVGGLGAGQSKTVDVPIGFGATVAVQDPVNLVQIAMKTSAGVVYFADALPVYVLFAEDGKVDKQAFLKEWRATDHEVAKEMAAPGSANPDALIARLEKANVFLIARRQAKGGAIVLYLSSIVTTNTKVVLLSEVSILSPGNVRFCVKSADGELLPAVASSMAPLLQ